MGVTMMRECSRAWAWGHDHWDSRIDAELEKTAAELARKVAMWGFEAVVSLVWFVRGGSRIDVSRRSRISANSSGDSGSIIGTGPTRGKTLVLGIDF